MIVNPKSINGVKLVTQTGMKVLQKKTFNKNLGRSPKMNLRYPLYITDSFLYGNRTIKISSRKEYNECVFMLQIKKLFMSKSREFQPQFSLN